MSEFGLVIVGGGGIAKVHIAAAARAQTPPAVGRLRIVAVVDPNESARRSAADAAGGAAAFSTFDEFLSSPQAKTARAAVVCTPPSARIPIVEAALARGISVLAEKPLAHTLADAK